MLTILSLFAGIGGFDLGIRLAYPETQTVCYVEIDGYCQRVLAARMSDGSLPAAPIYGDITTFDGRPWSGSVDWVVGGFPCQDLSTAGKRVGLDGERSGLWWEMLRVVGEVRPRYVCVENVPGLLVGGVGRVLGSLADLGYDAEWHLIPAQAVGAPHLRWRWWCLATTTRCGSSDPLESVSESRRCGSAIAGHDG